MVRKDKIMVNIKITQVTTSNEGYEVSEYSYNNVTRIFNDKECGLDTITIVFKNDKFDTVCERATFFTSGIKIDFITDNN